MHYYLVNTYENEGWGTRIDNYDVLIEQVLFKNRYRALKHIKSYGYELTKGLSGQDSRGNKVTFYYVFNGGCIHWQLIEIKVE